MFLVHTAEWTAGAALALTLNRASTTLTPGDYRYPKPWSDFDHRPHGLQSAALRLTCSHFSIYTETIVFKGGGGSGQKITKTRFRDFGWPKRSTHWANFLVGSWDPRPLGATVLRISLSLWENCYNLTKAFHCVKYITWLDIFSKNRCIFMQTNTLHIYMLR